MMSPTVRAALKWGAIIGLVNMLWLYMAYYLGIHTHGPQVFQIQMLVWLILTIAGHIRAIYVITGADPGGVTYSRGLALGCLAALVSAVFAVIAQVGYFTVIHPAWPTYMIEETRKHFEAQHLAKEDIDIELAAAREFFTLKFYAISSFITAFVMGLAISAVTMIFLRKRAVSSPVG